MFRTEISIPETELNITHKDKILMLGSCFAQNIGEKLKCSKFDVDLNPFGVLYNPISIAKSLELIISNKIFTIADLFQHNGVYHSFYHHSTFSDISAGSCLRNINERLLYSRNFIAQANYVIITFGSAFVYVHKTYKQVVSNCHKLPAKDFTRETASVDEIVFVGKNIIDRIRAINPSVKFIFTISPIRHISDGLHRNQLSKARLLLATEDLSKIKDTNYFPSYEIMLDDLRDYRFYDQDMLHPNETAIKYIWDKFSNSYFNKDTKSIIDEVSKIKKSLMHRPFNPRTSEHQQFLKQTLLRLDKLQVKYPYICLAEETEILKSQIMD